MDCEFSIPLNFEGQAPLAGEPFQFQYASCSSETLALIHNETNGAEFYIKKTLTYGELILIIFISIFLIFGIFKFVWNFIQQNWNFKL